MKTRYNFIIPIAALIVLFGWTSFAFAQNNADTVLLRPYGDDYREPKLYFENTPKTNVSVSAPVPTTTPGTDSATAPLVDPLFSGFNGKKTILRLKLDVSGVGKTCSAGTVSASPWKLNPDIVISDGDMLKNILQESVSHDYRIRRITVNEEKLDVYVLQPAKIFGFIPINYLFHIKVDANTFEFRLENPKWLKYANSDHANVADAIAGNISSSLTQERLQVLSETPIYHRHAVVVEKISTAFYLTPIYPYADNFWICVFIPYFILILIFFGGIIGYILFQISKKRRKRRARELFYGGDQEYDPLPQREQEGEEDELDRLIKAKKDTKNEETTFTVSRPRD